MTMDLKQFKENLLLYGSDMNQWPEDIQKAGFKTLKNFSAFQALLNDEVQFEKALKTRKYEEPGADLTKRIISASLHEDKIFQPNLGGFFSELFQEFSLPKPVLTTVCVLVVSVFIIGFAIGFSKSTMSVSIEQDQTDLQDFLYYEGEAL